MLLVWPAVGCSVFRFLKKKLEGSKTYLYEDKINDAAGERRRQGEKIKAKKRRPCTHCTHSLRKQAHTRAHTPSACHDCTAGRFPALSTRDPSTAAVSAGSVLPLGITTSAGACDSDTLLSGSAAAAGLECRPSSDAGVVLRAAAEMLRGPVVAMLLVSDSDSDGKRAYAALA